MRYGYQQATNLILLASFGIFLVALPVAPAFAMSSLASGLLIKYGMDRLDREMRDQNREKRRK